MTKKKTIWTVIIGVMIIVLVVGGVWFYRGWLSRTRIAFVNYQPIQLGEIVRANDNPMIVLGEVSCDNLADLEDYDMVFISGMGLHIDEEQRQMLKRMAASGKPFLSTGVTNPANDINNLGDDADVLKLYLAGGDRANYRSMLAYVRLYIDGKVIYADMPDEPHKAPDYLIYHPDPADTDAEELGFNSVGEYEEWLRREGLYNPDGAHVIVTGMMGKASDLVEELERQGIVAYYVTAIRPFVMSHQIDSVKPSAIINMAHGRMGDYMVEYLRSANIPLFAPLNVNKLAAEWEADKQGMDGGFLSQSVVTPEIDGAIRSYALFAHYINDEGIREVRAMPGRLEEFVSTVRRHIALRDKENGEKKLAIVYFKGLGQSPLVASGMEVVPSLYALLCRLRDEGYCVEGLPSSAQELSDIIMQHGPVFGTYAEGAIARYAERGCGVRVSAEEFESWARKDLSEELRRQLDGGEKGNETFPGSYLADGDNVILPVVKFGNVALLPQLPAGTGGDSFAMVHGAEMAPPYPYVCTYLWAREGFGADAILHFGTHGSLEYTPSKQNAVGDNDWSAALIGDVPHLYLYTIGNVGESLIAKRRTFATIQSHLTAPFKETGLRSTYNALSDAIDAYASLPDGVSEDRRTAAAEKVKELAHKMGMDSELRLPEEETYVYTSQDITRLESYAEEIANDKMTGRLYVLGTPYSEEDVAATVMAMTAEPIAYSLLALDKMRGKVGADFEKKRPSLFTREYIAPAKVLVGQLLKGKYVADDNLVCRTAGIERKDLERARETIERMKAPQAMMDMMTTAMQSSRNAGSMAVMMGSSKNDSSANTSGKKMPPAMMAKMKAMARSMSPEEALKKAKEMGASPEALARMEAKMKGEKNSEEGGKGDGVDSKMTHVSQEAKDSARVIMAVAEAIRNVGMYRNALIASPKAEMDAIVNTLSGGYTPPQAGGDPVANPNAIPTGRNLYGINAEATPSERAWQQGVELARSTIESYRESHDGDYPRKVTYTLWSGEFIETQGATVAQVLYMLGVEPVRDAFGRVNDLRLIPSGELGRPRIDVAVQTSGQLRDLAASRLFLINRAVSMAAEANDSAVFGNRVAEGLVASEKYLVDKGLSPREAREVARYRVFGAQNGGYGTGIQGLVEKGDAWETQDEIASSYLDNMNAFYGSSDEWQQSVPFAFEAALTGTDAIVQPRQSNTWGALSLDHVYEFTGGLSAAVTKLTGKEPVALMSDYRNHHHVKMQEMGEAISAEGRATLFNPAYIQEKMKGDAGSATEIASMVTNTYGWNAVRQSAVDKHMWDKIYATYVEDSLGIGTREFFESKNPAALQEMTAVMMESARKGFWNASESQLEAVAKLHTELIEKYQPACSGFVCDNAKLKAFIAGYAKEHASQYEKAVEAVREVDVVETADGKVLKKETLQSEKEEERTSIGAPVVVVIVALALVAMVVVIRRRRED